MKNDYSWITEVHSLMEPDFLQAYIEYESLTRALTSFTNIIGEIIKSMPDDQIIHLADLLDEEED